MKVISIRWDPAVFCNTGILLLNRKWGDTIKIFVPVVLLRHFCFPCTAACLFSFPSSAVEVGQFWGLFWRAGFMGGEVRLCLEKQAPMLYKVCTVSPHIGHLLKWDGNNNNLWKREKTCEFAADFFLLSSSGALILALFLNVPTIMKSRLSKSPSHPHPLLFLFKVLHVQSTEMTLGGRVFIIITHSQPMENNIK